MSTPPVPEQPRSAPPAPPRPVYLDSHATTPVDPRVAEAMWPYFVEKFGNASSLNHAYGVEAAEAVAEARGQVARLLRTVPESVIFTSGATEANNLAIKGALRSARPGSHLVTSAAEHRAVLDPAKKMQRAGYQVTVLPVDNTGKVDPEQVAQALRPETVLVSVMAANNEVGTLSDVSRIGAICRQHGVLFHCDAAQALGRVPVDLGAWNVDLLSGSAHKLYGPKGTGLLYVRRGGPRVRLEALQDGGGHEQRLRSGTLAVPLIVGFGRACELADECLIEESARLQTLRDRLWAGLSRRIPGLIRNGDVLNCLPGNLHVSVPEVDGDVLLNAITEVAVSSGSACTTAEPEPSHVLRAMGIPERLARASLRFGVGRMTTVEEIDFAVATISDNVARLRGNH